MGKRAGLSRRAMPKPWRPGSAFYSSTRNSAGAWERLAMPTCAIILAQRK